jgi:hypothetical protein
MKRRKHIGKGKKEKDLYVSALKKLDYEPTVDDSLDFSQSDNNKEELGLPKTKRKRLPPIDERIKEHFKENWVKWFIGLIGLVLSIFIFDFNRDLGRLEGSVSIILDNVKGIKDENNKLSDKIQSQELTTQEMQFKIKNLETNMKSEQNK